jgi:hypothetical protein
MVRQIIYLITIASTLIFSSCESQKIEQQKESNSTEQTSRMLKLYKLIDNQLHYWETWDNNDKSATVHWGIVGQHGENKVVKSSLYSNFRKTIQKEIDDKINKGYTELEDDKATSLEIEYIINGFGTEQC